MLAPIVARPEGLTVLLTQRASHLRAHSGQVAFPGGKSIPARRRSRRRCARRRRRSAWRPRFVEPLGWLDPYLTGTGFRIAPLVALITPGYALRLNPAEVEAAFETPLSFLMDEANHQIHEREWQGRNAAITPCRTMTAISGARRPACCATFGRG